MARRFTRRSALTIIAGCGASVAARRAWAEDKSGRVIYPVAVPVYQTQFVADRIGFFKEAGLDCKLIQGGSGVKTREIIASSQGDIGIGDITHPMQLSNHGRNGRVLMPVDTRSSSVMFIIRKDLRDQGITTLHALTDWKRPDGRKPIISVSSLGGTNHVWASYYMETMGLDQKVTWIGTGNVDTMLGSLKTKQVDVLVSSLSLLNESAEQGWGALLFDGTDETILEQAYRRQSSGDVALHPAIDDRQGPAQDPGVRHSHMAGYAVDQNPFAGRNLPGDRALCRQHFACRQYPRDHGAAKSRRL
jgi:ABC-type nitrate/sulfonate/bicarbonate transport systems, periplasmic components